MNGSKLTPVLLLALEPKTQADRERLEQGLRQLTAEDPTFGVRTDQHTGQIVIAGTGELQLEIIVHRLGREFDVEAAVGPLRVAYKEALTQAADGNGRYIRQTGGRGHFGEARIRVFPGEPGTGYVFESVGGAIPDRFIEPIDEGIQEARSLGVLAGYSIDDVRVELYDGSYHEVDSDENAFKEAGSMAFQDAAKKASPVLLEPVMRVEVVAPREHMRDVMEGLAGRRGQIQSQEDRDRAHVVRALVPMAEMLGYGSDLRSRTRGRATYSVHFDRYQPIDPHIPDDDRDSLVVSPLKPVPRLNDAAVALPEPDDEGGQARQTGIMTSVAEHTLTRRDVLRQMSAVVAAGALPPASLAETGAAQASGVSPAATFFPGFKPLTLQVTGATINGVTAGQGPPVLLLHGAPQSMIAWRLVAPDLAKDHTVIVTDLRGYGDSSKPPDDGRHANYSKRAMALDQVEVMRQLGFERFAVIGHDRGGRVGHRMALDHPKAVERLAVLDIVPTYYLYTHVTLEFVQAYFHWFNYLRAAPGPENQLKEDIERQAVKMTSEVQQEYLRVRRDPANIHGMCEDYRAGASIDLEHDRVDLDTKIACPVLALWGAKAPMGRLYDVLAVWRERATAVDGRSLPTGHNLQEDAPDLVAAELRAFLHGGSSPLARVRRGRFSQRYS